ncbi:MAG: cytochrome c biogenesis protein CcdA, partial [Candidatus Nitrosotenuis sp.]
MAEVTIAVAALAGLGSFLAPCILPVIPAFLAYISGTTITDLQRTKSVNMLTTRLNIFLNSMFFVLGFSVVFSIFGIILNSVLASSAASLTSSFNQVGGIIIIGFGGFML